MSFQKNKKIKRKLTSNFLRRKFLEWLKIFARKNLCYFKLQQCFRRLAWSKEQHNFEPAIRNTIQMTVHLPLLGSVFRRFSDDDFRDCKITMFWVLLYRLKTKPKQSRNSTLVEIIAVYWCQFLIFSPNWTNIKTNWQTLNKKTCELSIVHRNLLLLIFFLTHI